MKRDIYLPPGWVNYAEQPAAVVSGRRFVAQCAAGEKDDLNSRSKPVTATPAKPPGRYDLGY